MTVLGIAGPGDPLANPQRTFETFRMLTEQAPDIKLCVSTNGLALPDCVDELAKHNIDHVTITINCVDGHRRRDLPLDLLEQQAHPRAQGGQDPHRTAAEGPGAAGRARHPGKGQLSADPRRQR